MVRRVIGFERRGAPTQEDGGEDGGSGDQRFFLLLPLLEDEDPLEDPDRVPEPRLDLEELLLDDELDELLLLLLLELLEPLPEEPDEVDPDPLRLLLELPEEPR